MAWYVLEPGSGVFPPVERERERGERGEREGERGEGGERREREKKIISQSLSNEVKILSSKSS